MVIVGAVLIVAGVAQSWYYATVTYPTQKSQVEQNCLSYSPSASCVTLSPAPDQGPYVLGEFIAASGAILAILGGVRFAFATLRPAPRRRKGA